MNTLRVITCSFLFAGALAFTACSNGTAAAEEQTEVSAEAHGEGAEYTSAYVCPMHCEGSGNEEAGTCPSCGMEYVALADHTGNGHEH